MAFIGLCFLNGHTPYINFMAKESLVYSVKKKGKHDSSPESQALASRTHSVSLGGIVSSATFSQGVPRASGKRPMWASA